MKVATTIGTSNFREVRETSRYYIDKSFLISELYATQEKVVLLPRPRRFGKSLNLSMLHCFFDMNQRSGPLFEGLQVAEDKAAMSELNAYPTLYLSFMEMNHLTWVEFENDLRDRISGLVGTHILTVEPVADPAQKAVLKDLHFGRASSAITARSLRLLTELLFKATGQKVVVLVDEYDKPLHEGLSRGYFDEVVSFMRNLFGTSLKDNPYLHRAVITGILRIAKESIYSGLNNLAVYTILEERFSTCFGFTDSEVNQLLRDAGLADKEQGVKAWYNGYNFGRSHVIYNPWSLLNYVIHADAGLKAHWLGTSANNLTRQILKQHSGMPLSELNLLLDGGAVRKPLNINIGMREISSESIWNVLLFSGYLTANNFDPISEQADLSIPNSEIKLFFANTFSIWFGESSSPDLLITHLLSEQMDSFTIALQQAVTSILSYHDTGKATPERVYHVFVAGLVSHLRDRYTVSSNRETGDGRADLTLTPRKPGGTGFIFEFKSATKVNLEALAKQALKQIEERDYASALREAQVTRYVAIGLAFRGKRIALASFAQDLVGQARSAVQLYSEGAEESLDERSVSGALERSTMADGSGSYNLDEVAKKSAVVGQVQLLQQLNGETVLPLKVLLQIDSVNLEELRDQLKAKLQQAN